ncbi:MAG TPA: translocation/assembly module TamB domain-containing protein [Rudaea sp.]|nr:translocation/assembly module TamB domain-containing protein [Rudaea sp.]
MRKWLKRIGIALLVLVFLGTAFSLWLQYTQSGARFALARVQGAMEGKLAIADVGGTLSGPLVLTGVRYRDPKSGVDAKIGTVKVQFALSRLLGRVLQFENVDIDNVDIALTTIPPPAVPPPPTPLQQMLTPPLSIILDRMQLGHTRIALDTTPLFALDSLELSASWTNAGLAVRQFALRTPEGRVDLNGALTSYTDYSGKAKADLDWKVSQYRVAGSLDFTNDGRQSTFALTLTQPFPATVSGTLMPAVAALPWTLALDVPAFDPATIAQGGALKSLALNLRGSGDRNGGSLSGNVDANAHRVLLDPLKFALAGQSLTIENLHLRSPEAAGTLTAKGKLQLDAKPLGGEVQLSWDGVELPADLVGQALATHGTVDASGTAQQFAAQGDLALGPPGKLANIALKLDGTPEKIALRQLELKQPQGSLGASGEIVLQPQVGWKLDAKADRFDPGALAAQWPGSLSFALSTSGKVEKDGARGTLRLDKLSGTLRKRPLGGDGEIAFTPPLSVDGSLNLSSGNSHVALRGKGGAQTDASINLAITSLGDWLPQAGGSVQGDVSVKGAWPKLTVGATIHGAKIAYADSHIDTFDLDVQAHDVAAAPGGAVALKATRVSSAGYLFDTLSLDADGDQGKHSVKLAAHGTPLTLALAVDGTLTTKPNQAPAWRGTVDALDVQIKDQHEWQLTAPASASFAAGAFTLGELCLHAEAPSICVSATTRADGSLQSKYTLQHLPLGVVARLAAPDLPLRVTGDIDGSGDLSRGADGTLNGHASLASASGSIAYPDDAAQPLLAYQSFAVDAALSPQQSTVTVKADLNDAGKLDGHVTLGPNGTNGMPLAGEINAHLANLRFVDLLTTSLSSTQGKVDGRFGLAGTTSAPNISGQLALTEFATEVPAAGIKLRDGTISVHSRDGQTFDVDGSIASGDGKLKLSGSVGIGAHVPLSLKIDGENFLAADIPGAQVRISPALTLHRDEKRFALEGDVTIPRADIDVSKLPGGGATKVSPDVVITDEHAVPAPTTLPLDAVVTVKFGAGEKLSMDLRQGREVHLVGFGMNGYLGGQITVQDHPGKATSARGQIEVNGTYKAYGQDLTIEQGRLLFASTPVENPGLDIRATRAFPDQNVTVGLQVRGTAAAPVLSVFSTPAMEQSDALSYLVAGKPLSQLQGGEGNAVSSAARALGTAGGDLLAKSIGAKMGVDDVGVADSAAVGGAALTVGKYLSPRLYIGYGVGLFTPGEVVTVRYRLTHQFDAEVQNGTLSSRAGINYKIEK